MLQRVVIAMALASEPALLILDEPTTALDATVEAEVLDLIRGLRSEFDTSLLFISHNLAVIAKMCDRVGVLYAGELVEEGPAAGGLPRSPPPLHGRAAALDPPPRRAAATTRPRRRWPRSPARCRRPGSVPVGCIFADRCGLADERCRTETPPLYEIGGGRGSRCHYHERAQSVPSRRQPRRRPGRSERRRPPAAAGRAARR